MNPLPKLSQLSGLVWRILGCNPGPMTLQGTNIYLVGGTAKRVLIDAGQDGFPEYVNNLTTLLKEQDVTIEKIIITHWHQDHIGALKDLKNSFINKMPVVCKFPRTDVPDNPLPEGYNLELLKDNQVIKVDHDATLRILFTPGHTTDHASLFLEEEKAIFSGDCILGVGTAVFEDLHDYMLSLERLLEEGPSIIYPGHGPVVEEAKDKIIFYLQHRREREKQIIQVIRDAQSKGITPGQIVKIAYKDTPIQLHPAAELNVRHHLDKLLKQKIIKQREDTFSIGDETTIGKL